MSECGLDLERAQDRHRARRHGRGPEALPREVLEAHGRALALERLLGARAVRRRVAAGVLERQAADGDENVDALVPFELLTINFDLAQHTAKSLIRVLRDKKAMAEAAAVLNVSDKRRKGEGDSLPSQVR